MIRLRSETPPIRVAVHGQSSLAARLPSLTDFVMNRDMVALSRHPAWLNVLQQGLQHEVYALEAIGPDDRTCGFLPLAFVSSLLFGRFLVSLPYLNSNGVMAAASDTQTLLIQRAVELADELNVKHLELRHEEPVAHEALNGSMTAKVHMRLALPHTVDQLWKGFDTKVRNQVRKGEKNDLSITWGGLDQLDAFYSVLCQNMRDLGTPVYSRAFFAAILSTFPNDAEVCVVSQNTTPIACALLLHGQGVTEVPTASSLREYNATCANMLMYKHLLDRTVERGQKVFDFGRSTLDGSTFKFKKQWGAVPHPATWQYHQRSGSISEMRPENPRYQRMIRLWQRLPVSVTQVLGPPIVRGIP
ncbi:FemAB family PEP-CTERM system-associated protein [soil metagenome]